MLIYSFIEITRTQDAVQKKHTKIELGPTVMPVLSSHSKRRPKKGFQDRLSLNRSKVLQNAPREKFVPGSYLFCSRVLLISLGYRDVQIIIIDPLQLPVCEIKPGLVPTRSKFQKQNLSELFVKH